MKTCPYCAEAIQEDSQFCQFCGTNLGSPPVPAASSIAVAPTDSHTSGKAIASLICGIFFFLLPAAIVAIILGHLSYSEIQRSLGRIRGRGIALAGLILGYAGISFIPVLIIAAIAIPNLLRSKMAANEASAVGSMRTLNTASVTYSTTYGGYPHLLSNLAPASPATSTSADLVDSVLSGGTKSGYTFTFSAGTTDANSNYLNYSITAAPSSPGVSGQRYFYTDQSGVIRADVSATASASSTPLS